MTSESIFAQFEAIYKLSNLPDCNNRLIKDGIIDQELFYRQKTKILFIAKEHNFIGQPEDKEYKADYRQWWQEGVYLQFANRISEWAYGLVNDFPPYEQLTYDDKHEALKPIAFINVKKASGNSSANANHICQYIIASQSLLHQQISAISPTIIVCCFRYDYYVELLFGIKMKPVPSNIYSLGKWRDMDVINFYHPSARKNKNALYVQLSEAHSQLSTISLK